jgi:hypothetical protein
MNCLRGSLVPWVRLDVRRPHTALQAAEKPWFSEVAAIPRVRDRHNFNDCNTDLAASRSDRDRFRRRYTFFRSLFRRAQE